MTTAWLALKEAIESNKKETIEVWIKNNPMPPKESFYFKNPVFTLNSKQTGKINLIAQNKSSTQSNIDFQEEKQEVFSLWFWAYHFNAQNHHLIEKYFIENDLEDAYWFNKGIESHNTYGILDALVETNETDCVCNLIKHFPHLAQKVVLPKTIYSLCQFSMENQEINLMATTMYILFSCPITTFEQLNQNKVKSFLQSYFKILPSSQNCLFYFYEKIVQQFLKNNLSKMHPDWQEQEITHELDKYKENREKQITLKLHLLKNHNMLTQEECLYLACQTPIQKYFFMEIMLQNHFGSFLKKKVSPKWNWLKSSYVLIFSYLIKNSLKFKSQQRNDYLQTTVINHNYKILQWLLEFGLNPNEKDHKGMTPIHKVIKEKKFIDPALYQSYSKEEYLTLINLLAKHQTNLLEPFLGTNMIFHILKTENLQAHEKCSLIYEISQNSPWEEFKTSLKNFMKYLQKYELKFYNENLDSIRQLEVIVERKKLTYFNQFLKPSAYKETIKKLL